MSHFASAIVLVAGTGTGAGAGIEGAGAGIEGAGTEKTGVEVGEEAGVGARKRAGTTKDSVPEITM